MSRRRFRVDWPEVGYTLVISGLAIALVWLLLS